MNASLMLVHTSFYAMFIILIRDHKLVESTQKYNRFINPYVLVVTITIHGSKGMEMSLLHNVNIQ